METAVKDWSRLYSDKATISKQDVFCTEPILNRVNTT